MRALRRCMQSFQHHNRGRSCGALFLRFGLRRPGGPDRRGNLRHDCRGVSGPCHLHARKRAPVPAAGACRQKIQRKLRNTQQEQRGAHRHHGLSARPIQERHQAHAGRRGCGGLPPGQSPAIWGPRSRRPFRCTVDSVAESNGRCCFDCHGKSRSDRNRREHGQKGGQNHGDRVPTNCCGALRPVRPLRAAPVWDLDA